VKDPNERVALVTGGTGALIPVAGGLLMM